MFKNYSEYFWSDQSLNDSSVLLRANNIDHDDKQQLEGGGVECPWSFWFLTPFFDPFPVKTLFACWSLSVLLWVRIETRLAQTVVLIYQLRKLHSWRKWRDVKKNRKSYEYFSEDRSARTTTVLQFEHNSHSVYMCTQFRRVRRIIFPKDKGQKVPSVSFF